MVYISESGSISNSRPWTLSSIPDMFWALVDFIVLFFQTMINPDLSKKGSQYSTSYRSGGGPPPPPPRRRFGGLGPHGGGVAPPPMMGGG